MPRKPHLPKANSLRVTTVTQSSILDVRGFLNCYVVQNGGIQLLRSHSGGKGIHQNANACEQDERGVGGGWWGYVNVKVYTYFFLIQYLAHKLLAVLTKFFVMFIKIPVFFHLFMIKLDH